jgi:hypothetical protein
MTSMTVVVVSTAIATSLRALPPFAGPGADQLALEFGKAAEHSQHEPAVRASWCQPKCRPAI